MLVLPDSSKRVTINGRTGSGKTVFASWLLIAAAELEAMPWTVIDFKGDELLAALPAQPISVFASPPKEPGLYYMHPAPHDRAAMHNWLWRVWERGNHGLMIDEGYMVPDQAAKINNPFKTLLAQGRALQIPVWTLSQRPVELNKHVFSEADFYCCFHLNDRGDRDRVADFTPDNDAWDQDVRLKPFHSRWYDVGRDYSCVLGPCPPVDEIMKRFVKRLAPKRKFL